jgi:transcriptional regulator with XRE-family HTH domain
MLTKRLGMRLKRLRTQRQLNQADLAKKVGVTQAYIAMLERGAFKNPTLDVLQKLAKALKVTVAELVK